MNHPWAIPVPLLPGELFSTWLARTALAQGCDPMDLTGSLWPRWRAWTVDLDRGLSPERLEVLALRSGVDAAQLEEATLRPVVTAINPERCSVKAMWPWVLSLGSRNRRRFGGLQYCPYCLAEDQIPYFRRSWRLVWHVGCVRHGNLLADHCGRCHAPAEPHRSRATDMTLCRCPSCGFDLRGSVTLAACAEVLAFQEAADEVLHSGYGVWEASLLPREVWFQKVGKLANVRIRVRQEDSVPSGLTALQLNLQRPSERVLRLRMAYRSMLGEPCGAPLLPSRKPKTQGALLSGGSTSKRFNPANPTPAQPQIKVQGEWVRLLRRVRVVQP